MSRQYTLFPKLQIPPGSSAPVASLDSMTSSPKTQQHSTESNSRNHIYRAKRKHVLKACDRCRVKKTKCDGDQPCNRCATYNHPCLFGERRATQTKVYSRGFVEMLESHHALVVKALQQLYKHCINNEGFPGEPLDTVDGYPLTHAILDRLGLIKLGESGTSRVDEENAAESWNYWRHMSLSTDSNGIDDASPEPISPTEPAPLNLRGSSAFSPTAVVKCEQSGVDQNGQCGSYPAGQSAVPFEVAQAVAQTANFTHPQINTGFAPQEKSPFGGSQHADLAASAAANNGQCSSISSWCIPRDGSIYSDIEGFPGHLPNGTFEQGSDYQYQQNYTLDSGPCYVWPYSPM